MKICAYVWFVYLNLILLKFVHPLSVVGTCANAPCRRSWDMWSETHKVDVFHGAIFELFEEAEEKPVLSRGEHFRRQSFFRDYVLLQVLCLSARRKMQGAVGWRGAQERGEARICVDRSCWKAPFGQGWMPSGEMLPRVAHFQILMNCYTPCIGLSINKLLCMYV